MADPVSIASLAVAGIGLCVTVKTVLEGAHARINRNKVDVSQCTETLDDCSELLEAIEKGKHATSDYACKKVAELQQLLEKVKDVLEEKNMHKFFFKSRKVNNLFKGIKKKREELLKLLGSLENNVLANVIEMEDGIMFWKRYVGISGNEKPSLQTIADSISKASFVPLRYTLDTFFSNVSSSNTEVDPNEFSKFVKLVSTYPLGPRRLIICEEELSDGKMKYYGPYSSVSIAIKALVEENSLHDSVSNLSVTSGAVSGTPALPTRDELGQLVSSWVEVINEICPYFHGLVKSDIKNLFPKSSDDSGLLDGHYLLRYSSNAKNTATFSFVKDGRVRNIRICRSESNESLV